MAKKWIKRTVTQTTADVTTYYATESKEVTEKMMFTGHLEFDDIMHNLMSQGKLFIFADNIKHETVLRRIPLDVFIANSEVVEIVESEE